MGGNRWETGVESAEWIRVRAVSSRGDKREHWNEKVWTMFLTSSKRLTAAARPHPTPARNALGPDSFLLSFFFSFGIDRFFMDSSLHASHSGLSGDSTAGPNRGEFLRVVSLTGSFKSSSLLYV